MKQKIVHEQLLQQKMNKSLIQAINVLQFSSTELLEYIQQVTKDNPLIEEVSYDYELAEYRSNNSASTPFEDLNERTLSMSDQLKEQLYTININPEYKPIVNFGIDSLDDSGYLDITLDEWATQCETSLDKVEQALTYIQSLDPTGIGARSLRECIILQLKQMNLFQFYMEDLLDNKLAWVAEENLDAIANEYQITRADARKAIQAIQGCHPKPGTLLVEKKSEFIIPEAVVRKEAGEWRISFYSWSNPTITMDETYKDVHDVGQEAESYLKEKYNQVDWLQYVLTYRKNTLERVIYKIVEKQASFFEHGYFMLQPFTLQKIADELGVHVSTVSRAIRGKYVQTNYGVLPLKFFLQPGIKQRDGKFVAAFTIKKVITELVEFEDKHNPLSDEVIRMKIDNEFGIKIARRTVMKYREQLGIPSSMKRKVGGN
ncbi:RNA polymerase, sigma 54 subunit, RpoN/SigL [Oceanobacillus limi]|uniref:RNA polymerase, sigma 54 subunit, RpoN/SigL n=1 Tax=Oceanobacillus limi TaxID=930131 RepID=A0A1I0BU77_9BACI|nr:RNA polymerase factor sigma-54 [Oceanobacillus limi]SET10698.1 RNA polymerase, sigma 54 subunit, RpoN/SigL [Oceanobacillus limi]